jgi:protein gp37
MIGPQIRSLGCSRLSGFWGAITFAFSLPSPKTHATLPKMSGKSEIEWTDATWNPVRGCTKISPGCAHCYAEVFAERFRGVSGHPYEQGFDLRLVPEKLLEPIRWPQSRMVFVNSMSDLFHEDVPDAYIEAVAAVMQHADWHVYQVLTKRSARLRDLLCTRLQSVASAPHIWWGVSVENRRVGLPRIRDLRRTNARVRFLSIEPLLEDLGAIDLTAVDWVIVGGESGAGARPIRREWVVSVQRQCRSADVPFFFKQWGGVRKSEHGRTLHGRTYDEFPEVTRAAPPDRSRRMQLLDEMQARLWPHPVVPVYGGARPLRVLA